MGPIEKVCFEAENNRKQRNTIENNRKQYKRTSKTMNNFTKLQNTHQWEKFSC